VSKTVFTLKPRQRFYWLEAKSLALDVGDGEGRFRSLALAMARGHRFGSHARVSSPAAARRCRSRPRSLLWDPAAKIPDESLRVLQCVLERGPARESAEE
jgi:hypothetical protein